MKKIVSLIKACMTSDMSLFKIKGKKNTTSSKIGLPLFIAFLFMFSIWSYANGILEKLAPLNLQYVALSLFVFITSIITVYEGIYKSGSLLFNCKDDQLLLSLPIKKSTVLFIRIFKFYIFELMFNSLFIIPLIIAYIRWDSVNITFFITSLVMLIFLPIIPIVISCILGFLITDISSRFKYKNITQIVTTMILLFLIMLMSLNLEKLVQKIAQNATSINDFITKIYYPAGIYAKLVNNFNIVDLIIFILINILIFIIGIFILSKVYFKINNNLKSVTTTKKLKLKANQIKARSQINSLIRKEINTFFNTPVFIINAGFGIIIYIILAIGICIKLDSILDMLVQSGMDKNIILSNIPAYMILVVSIGAFTTSITSSMISLEGRNYTILKSLPVEPKKILMSKIYAASLLTIPAFILGDLIMFIKLKMGIIEMLLIIILTILMPLVSHFLGIIINTKYPKLEFENAAEVVKQSTSTFISVTIGFVLLLFLFILIPKLVEYKLSSILILLLFIIIFIIIDIVLYSYITKKTIKEYEKLTI